MQKFVKQKTNPCFHFCNFGVSPLKCSECFRRCRTRLWLVRVLLCLADKELAPGVSEVKANTIQCRYKDKSMQTARVVHLHVPFVLLLLLLLLLLLSTDTAISILQRQVNTQRKVCANSNPIGSDKLDLALALAIGSTGNSRYC